MNKFFKHFNLLFFLSTFFSCQLYAQSNAPQKRQIKVVTEYLEPYQIKNQDGSLGGFSTEIVNALFKKVNAMPDIKVMSWGRAYDIATSERNVMIFSIAHTPERDKLFHWIGPLTQEHLFFWGLKSKFPNPIPTVALLKGYKIAASRSSNIEHYLKANNFFDIYPIVNEEQSMLMLYRDRIDLIIDNEINIKYRAQTLGIDFNHFVKLNEVTELNNDLSIAFGLNTDSELVKEFQQAFNQLLQQENGTVQQIKKKWHID